MRLRNNKEVTFEEFTHEYFTKDDRYLIGVTSLLHKHNIGPDFKGIPQQVLTKAADYGTLVHNAIERYACKKSTYTPCPEVDAYKTLNLDVHCCEYLVSDNETVASKIDLVLEDCSLVDIKTWAAMDADRKKYVTWQLSIYAYLFELQNPSHKVPHIYVARVREDHAELIELKRIPEKDIKDLIRCEKEGIIYEVVDNTPEASLALPENQAVELASALDTIAAYKLAIKREEERSAAIQESLYNYMTEHGLEEMKCSMGRFYLRAGSSRTTIDSTKLKQTFPDIATLCSKTITTKGSVVFKSNNQ